MAKPATNHPMEDAPQGSIFGGDTGGTPLVLSYGMGVDSTGVMMGWAARGIRPDLIMFANVGAERRGTYAYRPLIDAWLAEMGWPAIVDVSYVPRHGYYTNLAEDCLLKGMLPSLAYGHKSCSSKFKIQPQEAYLKTWRPAIACWSRGGTIDHAIGYDAGPKDSRRGTDCRDGDLERITYPLREWGWDRERCIQEIEANGMLVRLATEMGIPPVPPKSACYFCPSTKPDELGDMAENEPDALGAALAIEGNALQGLTTVAGLWRKETRKLPGSWGEYARDNLGDATAATAENVSRRFVPSTEPRLAKAAENDRYATARGDQIVFHTGFKEAIASVAKGQPIHAKIAGRWFAVSPAATVTKTTPRRLTA